MPGQFLIGIWSEWRQRAMMGFGSKLGGIASNGSGDYVIGFQHRRKVCG